MDATPQQPRYARQLREVAGLHADFMSRLAASLDLNATALDAMEWLMAEGPLTPSDLAARLHLTPGGVTNLVNRLEATGHAHREQAPGDGRSVRVVPTPASVATALERLGPLIGEMTERTGTYTAAEMATIERFLGDVSESYAAGIDGLTSPGSATPRP